jgi:hypothetical protein
MDEVALVDVYVALRRSDVTVAERAVHEEDVAGLSVEASGGLV